MSLGTNNPYFAKRYTLKRWKRGPLSPYLDGFIHRLSECNYSPATGGDYIRCIGHWSLWLEEKGLAAHQLDQCKIDDYLQAVKHQRGVVISSAPHRFFLSYLRELGVIPRPEPKAAGKIDSIVDEYLDYLRNVRGLAESTLVHRRLITRRFLMERFASKSVRLSRLNSQDVIRHIQAHVNEYCVLYRSQIVQILRDFYRFLHLNGSFRKDIASGILAPPFWKPTPRPAYLNPPDMDRLLAACERTTPLGLRNYAILVMLIRLGVRSGEVQGLTLDDIDWQTGQITVCGKGNKRRQLPLLHEVGEALAAYLKEGRPPSPCRYVFLRMRAPWKELTSTAIYKIVKNALKESKLNPPKRGPHLLRHSFATHLRSQGAMLPEVGRMLGHDHTLSPAAYAHVAPNELQAIIEPWPGGVS